MERTDYAVVTAAVLCIVDGLMTLPHWHLEGNPVVLLLGPVGMMAVKVAAVAGFVSLWFLWEGVDTSRIAKACVWGVTALYVVVVVTNGLVLFVV